MPGPGRCGGRGASGSAGGAAGGGLVGQERRQGQRAEAGARPPQQLAAARQRIGSRYRLHRNSSTADVATSRLDRSVNIDKFILAQDQVAISFPRSRRPRGQENCRSELQLVRRGGRPSQGVEPADAGLGRLGPLACEPRRPGPGPISLTNGSFRKKRACGATTDSPRRATIEPGSARSNRRPKSVAPAASAHGLKVQGPPRYGQVRKAMSPRAVASRRPATASRLSRIASASRRRRFIRPKRRFSGSLASASAAGAAALLIGRRQHDRAGASP